MRMCHLLDCSDNYFMKSGGLWNYYENWIIDDADEKNDDDYKASNEKITISNFLKYQTKIKVVNN